MHITSALESSAKFDVTFLLSSFNEGLEKVDGNALDKFCPVDSCSDYIPETGMPNLPTWSEPQVPSILPSPTTVFQDFQNILLYRSSLLSTMATSSTKEKLMTKKMMVRRMTLYNPP